MTIRVLDDLVALPNRGVLLFSMDEDHAPAVQEGMVLIDALNAAHPVKAVTLEDGVYSLHLPQGDPAYFERLFRNVRVDATLLHFQEGVETPCP